MQEVTIVGAGLSGLIAAIQIAEQGGCVVLHEAGAKPGGRARTDASLHRVNLGPHAIYRRGAFGRWLIENELLPPVHYPSITGLRLVKDQRTRRMVSGLPRVMRSASRSAPIDESYRSWATREYGADFARLAIGFASLPTYHPDPGILSAAFVQERIARSSEWRPVWYVKGGWINLIDRLAAHAENLGVEILTRSKLNQLPNAPCIVATDLPAASKLLDEPDLNWPSPDNALLDIALKKRWGDPTALLDVDNHAYISSYSAGDASVAPRGESLLQGVTGMHPGEKPEVARQRVHALLDAGFKHWRDRVVWKRTGVTNSAVGPCDPPGTSWRDRPAIDRGRGRWLIGDRVAAPGILAETCFESARMASELVLAKIR
jgi:phytoene dehydrogenase-like protein